MNVINDWKPYESLRKLSKTLYDNEKWLEIVNEAVLHYKDRLNYIFPSDIFAKDLQNKIEVVIDGAKKTNPVFKVIFEFVCYLHIPVLNIFTQNQVLAMFKNEYFYSFFKNLELFSNSYDDFRYVAPNNNDIFLNNLLTIYNRSISEEELYKRTEELGKNLYKIGLIIDKQYEYFLSNEKPKLFMTKEKWEKLKENDPISAYLYLQYRDNRKKPKPFFKITKPVKKEPGPFFNLPDPDRWEQQKTYVIKPEKVVKPKKVVVKKTISGPDPTSDDVLEQIKRNVPGRNIQADVYDALGKEIEKEQELLNKSVVYKAENEVLKLKNQELNRKLLRVKREEPVTKTVLVSEFKDRIRVPVCILNILEQRYKTTHKYLKIIIKNFDILNKGNLPENLGKTKSVRIPKDLIDVFKRKIPNNYREIILLLLYNLSQLENK